MKNHTPATTTLTRKQLEDLYDWEQSQPRTLSKAKSAIPADVARGMGIRLAGDGKVTITTK